MKINSRLNIYGSVWGWFWVAFLEHSCDKYMDVLALNVIVLFTRRESNRSSSHAVCMAVLSFLFRDDCVVLQHCMDCFYSNACSVLSQGPFPDQQHFYFVNQPKSVILSFHRWMFLGNIRANSFFLSKYHTRNPSLRSCFLPSFLFLLLSILSFHFVVRFYFFFAPDLSLFLEEIWVHSECCTREHCYEHPRTEHAMCSSDVLFFCLPWYLPTYLWRRMVTFKVQIHF